MTDLQVGGGESGGGEEGERKKRDNPTTNGGMQKWKLCRNMYTLRTRFFARLAPICMPRSVIINKNFCTGAQLEVY